ncbi:uncharacterized protein LOC129899927 [Solanum dulcamara]|uniref:uncharacterized protein LOC129899927 n=1 Tax=Solanum dulcamara TaxID=45834 RepID=UPI0024865D77|nr:uncharacterized protein LOC129899927 [Solanum dulcamara]
MNPLKCAFGVTSGKFLGFIVRHCGIEVNPTTIDSIQKMPAPKILRELHSLQGNLKAVKGQALTNFLADHPFLVDWEVLDEFSDKDALYIEELSTWTMFFDGIACRDGMGAGVVLISPKRLIFQFSFTLGETCSNNISEYQALIIGLEMASDMKITQLDIYGDSELIINQLLGSYEVKKEDFFSYHQYAVCLLQRFDHVFLNHVPREESHMADALAKLATIWHWERKN